MAFVSVRCCTSVCVCVCCVDTVFVLKQNYVCDVKIACWEGAHTCVHIIFIFVHMFLCVLLFGVLRWGGLRASSGTVGLSELSDMSLGNNFDNFDKSQHKYLIGFMYECAWHGFLGH